MAEEMVKEQITETPRQRARRESYEARNKEAMEQRKALLKPWETEAEDAQPLAAPAVQKKDGVVVGDAKS